MSEGMAVLYTIIDDVESRGLREQIRNVALRFSWGLVQM